MAKVTWLGHGCWTVETGEHRLIVDPYLDESPSAAVRAADVSADFVLLSHAHFDHVGDVAAIVERTGALLVTNFDLCQWFAKTHGIENSLGMNLGGETTLPFGRLKMTIAHHSSALPDGTYGGNPCGFLLRLNEGKTIYFACDTALFGDMAMIGRAGIDLAVLPIGDLFTMGPADSIEAIKLLAPKQVCPSHFGTWPPIAQDAEKWAAAVAAETSAKPVVLQPGGSVTI